jgi:GT2 family glycosyltransferase
MLSLSIVTPSLNQARYLRSSLHSVAAWQSSKVEHIVIDGGSTDDSVRVIDAYAEHLDYWVSEPDEGQYHAINRGFSQSTGEIMAWLNADDMYFPWTISTAMEIFEQLPSVEWLTTRRPMQIDSEGRLVSIGYTHGFDKKSFLSGFNLCGAGWPADVFIQQESTFWRRSLWDKTGSRLDTSLTYAADFDLWARFFGHTQLHAVDVPLAAYRRHAGQKMASSFGAYVEESKLVLARYAGALPDPDVMTCRVPQRRTPETAQALLDTGLADAAPILLWDFKSKSWAPYFV